MSRTNYRSAKLLVLTIMLTVFANQLLAQTNTTGIFFQAVARDNFSNPAKERKIYVQSSIIQTTTNGTSLLVEEYQVSTDGTGMFSISIGNGTRVGGTVSGLNAIDWSQGPFYLNLKIAITPVAGNVGWDYTKEWVNIGTTSFGAVPYALYSANAGGVNQKLSITDTTKMLAVYAKSQVVQALSTTVETKLSAKDTLSMLAPYARAAYVLDSAYINAQLKSKIAIADSGKSYTTPLSLTTAINSAVDAGKLIGTTLNATVTGSSLTSVGTLANLTVTNPIVGSITGNAASATTAASAGTASTATKLAIARNINGVAFDGSGDITITPTVDAGNLTGTTLKSTITTSSLTSLGTLANLTVTNPIAGSITGNAATATIAGNITNTSNSTLTSLPNLSSFGTITSGTISLTTNIKTSGTLTTGAVTYPKVDGSNGQVLTTNGAGVPTWITPTTGGVDLITNQTIGGAKAFSNNIYVQGLQAGLGSGSQSTLFGAATYAGTNGTAIGFMSQNGNSGTNNTSIGSNTLRNSGAASNNTVIGAEAGQAMGNGNTIIGASASANNNSAVSNSTAIGAGAIVTTSNTIQLGNTSVTDVKTSGTLTAGGLILTNQPFIPPVLSQSQVDAINAPTEGMLLYNLTQRKLQLYSIGNSNIINDGFSGTYTSGADYIKQTFVVPATGTMTQIQLYAKSDVFPNAMLSLNLNGTNNFGAIFSNLTTSPQWMTIPFNTPVSVVAGQAMYFIINGPELLFSCLLGSNSAYSNGSVVSFNRGTINGDDLMFRILITPANGSAYWINLN